MSAAAGVVEPAVVAWLAREVLPGDPRSVAVCARDGITAGVASFAERNEYRGYAGTGRDGVWRSWAVQRRRVELCVKHTAPVRTTVRALMEWAAPYLTKTLLAELETALAERAAAVDLVHADEGLWQRRTYYPSRLTDAERTVLAEAERRRFAAEAAARAAVVAALAIETAPGTQLDLFTTDALTLF